MKERRKKKLPADFKPAKPVLQVFPGPAGRRGLGSVFFLSCGSTRIGAQSGLQIITGAQFPAHALRTLWPTLSNLHICTRPAPIIHLVFQPFYQSGRRPEWEQIAPPLLPPRWPWATLTQGSCMAAQFFFERCCLPLLTSAGLSTQSTSLTSSESIWVTAHLFSQLQV